MRKFLLILTAFVLSIGTTDFAVASSNNSITSVKDTDTIKREEYIRTLYKAFDPICRKYGINTKVAISQAIAEQGWELRKDFRIFNIASTNPTRSKLVYDNGEQRYRRYRIYTSLEQAVEDYCKVLTSFHTYRKNGLFETLDPNMQIESIAKGGYATNPKYQELVTAVMERFVSPVVDYLREEEALARRSEELQSVTSISSVEAQHIRFCLPSGY
ncbi:glucosaminidase domain-containing protein [Flammeovirga sp. OC4]|uniref:glucosaminidase domain-containing protein n=1 Tax=Flammeovirga sp. OC4 TaxID=1382345 RepID=UPI0005C67179|nr:glucosaminidase domain-containing protein [Flammeovirga sp. OC4]